MQRSIETQPASPSIFEGLRLQITAEIYEAKEAKKKAGEAIKQGVSATLSLIKRGVLPKLIDVADITPYTRYSPQTLIIIRHNTESNELLVVSRRIGNVEDFTNDPFQRFNTSEEGQPRHVSLPEDQQSEEVLRVLENEAWVHYGPLIVDRLEKATQKFKETEK